MTGTDWNDLQVEEGRDKVKAQLLEALKDKPQSPAPSVGVSETNKTKNKQNNQQKEPPDYLKEVPPATRTRSVDNRYSIDDLINSFWYVYGTDTVWDNINRLQMKLAHLSHAVGRTRYKSWCGDFKRKIVYGLAFEPGVDLGDNKVNLYDGFEMDPHAHGATGCERIINHVARMCNDRDDEFWWLLRWLAYPLQYPGAKMASSVIMYGSEGPGKSVLFENVIKRIYGRYGTTIGQAELESQFTGWQGELLFALAEEVVSRSERSHLKGQLKHLVTGDTLMINEKMLPVREESNHINFVFLSNSTIPLELDYGDRRYLVLYVDYIPEENYFTELFKEINGDGVACFYRFLLDLDLAGFTPHTKPPVNEEKQGLITMSLPSPIHFVNLWRDGELDLPYCSATAGDLYTAFKGWAEQNGEFKRTERFFGGEAKRVLRQARHNICHPYAASPMKTHRIYITENDLKHRDDKNYISRIAESCNRFRLAMDGNQNRGLDG